eukprot:6492384-Amphidinium_carterae.1
MMWFGAQQEDQNFTITLPQPKEFQEGLEIEGCTAEAGPPPTPALGITPLAAAPHLDASVLVVADKFQGAESWGLSQSVASRSHKPTSQARGFKIPTPQNIAATCGSSLIARANLLSGSMSTSLGFYTCGVFFAQCSGCRNEDEHLSRNSAETTANSDGVLRLSIGASIVESRVGNLAVLQHRIRNNLAAELN